MLCYLRTTMYKFTVINTWLNWEDVDLEEGCCKRLELKCEQKFFEFCLWRLEANCLSHLSSVMLGFSNKLWHLFQCKRLDDKGDSVLIANPTFSPSYEGIKRRFKSNGDEGILIVEAWSYYWWIYCKYIHTLRKDSFKNHGWPTFCFLTSGKYCGWAQVHQWVV